MARKSRKKAPYRVFISHSGDDMWLACQLAAVVEPAGAETFLDVRDIAHGDNFKARIKEELPKCRELVALFTPWSRQRLWVHNEIGMAQILDMRIVCVFYHVEITGFGSAEGGWVRLTG